MHEGADPEHEAVIADSVGLALLVVLEIEGEGGVTHLHYRVKR